MLKSHRLNGCVGHLHDEAAGLREKDVVALEELSFILWGDQGSAYSAATWALTTNKLQKFLLGGRKYGFRFEDVERAVVAMLPTTFPYLIGAPRLLCEDAMSIARTNETHAKTATYFCMFCKRDIYPTADGRLAAGIRI
ncbi:hypothetical protein [Massilia sp. TWP1-3-3]|uniref:hypothetical protein n=1 Tax=Massilia sp. TWP1-3-3 TaxID=2804573 RepID=UPI003CEE1BAA